MKKAPYPRPHILVLLIALLALSVKTSYSGNFHFGVISAIKDKVEEIKEEKEKDKLPTITITTPADGSTVSGTISVTAAATDDKGVSKVEFYIDGTLQATDTTEPYSYTLDTTQYADGIHTIEVKAYNMENQSTSSQCSVTVNNVGGDKVPTITLTAPADGATVSGTVSVTATASDDQGVSKVEFYIDNTLKATVITSPYSYSWDTVQYSSGTHTVKTTVYDTANQTASAQCSVTVSNSTDEWQIYTVDSIGDVGEYASMALDSNNNPHFAYYDETNGDLKYAKWIGSAWSIQIVDSIGDVGEYTSIALDSNNYPHIAYQDNTNKDLKYAKWTGSAWSIETVDSTDNVGEETAIALDSNNYPHITYKRLTNTVLKYARWTGSSWSIEIIESSSPDGADSSSIIIDATNSPHIAYSYNALTLKYAKKNGAFWTSEIVDSMTSNLIFDTSIILDSNNDPHIAYACTNGYGTDSRVKYAKWTGSVWSIDTVKTSNSSTNVIGYFSQMALDSSNQPHIVYCEGEPVEGAVFSLKYAKWTSPAWVIETVADGIYPSIAIDSNDYVYIGLSDGDLKCAAKRILAGGGANDNTPTVNITSPIDGSIVSGTVAITADASGDKGISKVEFSIDGTLKSTDTTSPYSYSWNTVQYNSGTHIFKATVYDTANQTATDQHAVTVLNGSGWAIETVELAGSTGHTTSIKIDTNNNPHIAYYNGDLSYAKWTGLSWGLKTVDSVVWSGEYTSLDLDTNNNPHIAYSDWTNKDLRYAKWTGSSWDIQTVDSTGEVGDHNSIALDSNNNPHIAYYDKTNGDLKYAKWTGYAWSIITVDSSNWAGYGTSIALDSNNNPHISYYNFAANGLKYAKWTGLAWNIETIDSSISVKDTAIALDISNKPHIAYYGNSDLKYAKWTGLAWNIETVDSSITGTPDEGCSIAIGTDSSLHISYYDDGSEKLKYAKWTGVSWTIEDIDSGLAGFYGTGSSIALDDSNKPHISYYDSENNKLKHAVWK